MEIPSKYSPDIVEKKIYTRWLEKGRFRAVPSEDKKPFTIIIPPPNVTGILHMGHALNNTIQDVVIRFKRMRGYESLWMPGTDHAGIATQNVMERQLAREGLTKEKVGREKFVSMLWDWTRDYGSTIIEQLKRLGASCDWDRLRFTLDRDYSDAVNEVFAGLYDKGLIYRGNYMVNWCPRCGTALSDEESPYKQIKSWLYFLRYPVKRESSSGKGDLPPYVVVATTRPETMLGDTALAVNPGDGRYNWLKKNKVELPLMNRVLDIVEDDSVEPEFGTGIVKVTPAHDPADFAMGKKHNLKFINIMNPDGTLNSNAGEFSGMDRFEAREAIIEKLRQLDLLEKEEPYVLNAGHCYRCETIIEPRISPQWFVKMRPLAQPAIEAVEKDEISFQPLRWKKVYLNWMYNIQDWCISRQIWWGHRIPVWYCDKCLESIEDEHSGEFSGKGVIVSAGKPDKCPWCGNKQLTEEKDVLDTWFSSWLWPFATFYWPFKNETGPRRKKDYDYFYPTNMLVTAGEILFFWVARMIMASLEFTGKIPFNKVVIHGTVRDERGVKMSKSLGNTIDPLKVIDEFGVDALRFSLMLLASSGSDVYLSEEKFLVGRNFSNKIWNAARFMLMRIDEQKIKIDAQDNFSPDITDKWLLNELNRAVRRTTEFYEKARINEAVKEVYDFFWHTLCDWYIEMIKDNVTPDKAKVLVFTFVRFLKLLHPVMPFITEEVYGLIKENVKVFGEEDIISSAWPEERINHAFGKEVKIMDDIIQVIKEVRNLKVIMGLAPSQKAVARVKADEAHYKFFMTHKTWITRLASLSDVEFEDSIPRVLLRKQGLELGLLLEDFEEDKFLSSLDKKIGRLNKQIASVSDKLNNRQFVENAPAEVVERSRLRLSETEEQLNRLTRLKETFTG